MNDEETRTLRGDDSLHGTSRPPDESDIGQKIGRFVVLERIGRGGMGTVFSAYDANLDRRVAVKVLRGDRQGIEGYGQRLWREAQAMARLSHPNVVTVHEVGWSNGAVFVAMEFVQGQDLAEWLACKPTWTRVLEVLVRAGRGLAAAHRAGLIHRDFKPHNVLRSDDGAVKVLDFGLARSAMDNEPGPETSSSNQLPSSSTSSLTLPGTIMGTPTYMAPEQHQDGIVDARSDQYGFCVTLWTCLAGRPPFEAEDLDGLLASKLAGPPPWNEAERAIPRRIVAAIRRGLSPDPADRWPSMESLLEVLGRSGGHRWQWALGLTATAGLGLAAVMSSEPRSQCQGMESRMDGVWDEDRGAEVREAFIATELPYAEHIAERISVALDERSQRWLRMRTDACEATHVRGEQSAVLLDRRMACFDDKLEDLRSLVDLFSDADRDVVDRAALAVSALPRLDACTDDELLDDTMPEDPQLASFVRELRRRASDARVMGFAGRYAEAIDRLDAIIAEAEPLPHPSPRTEALVARGGFRAKMGQYEDAEADLVNAYRLAMKHRRIEWSADAAVSLTKLLGYDQARHDEARVWGLQAEVLAGSLPGRLDLQAQALNTQALVSMAQGRLDHGRDLLAEAIELHQRAGRTQGVEIAFYYNNLGVAALESNDLQSAAEAFEHALRIRQREYGPNHPLLAETLNNLGGLALQNEDLAGARDHLERALQIRERSLGPDHPDVAAGLDNVGVIALEQGRLDEAEQNFRAALHKFERSLGPSHAKTSLTLQHLGELFIRRGDELQGIRFLCRAFSVCKSALGAEHPRTTHLQERIGELGGHCALH